MSDALVQVAELVRQETGIVIKEAQLPALAAALARAAPDVDAKRFLAEIAGRLGAGSWVARLVDEVTVKETYFLREARELQAVDWRALLKRARAGGADTVRVWISACATGEEAYTFAMLASEALGPRPPVSILASDISTAALELAHAGRYSERSLRNLTPALRTRYFEPEGSQLSVRQSLRSLVRFRHHNLVNDPAPPPGEVAFDVIACRNVLIYFDRPTVERVIGSLESALGPEGVLVLGVADRLSGTAGRLARTSLVSPAPERRAPRAPRRVLRRPLGLEGSGPSGPAGASAAASEPGKAARVDGGDRPDPVPRRRLEDRIEDALEAADKGDLDAAIAISGQLLAREPLNADAYFVRGLAELGLGEAAAAIRSFRRALYLDPSFGLAAFELGRAHDAQGDQKAARRVYEQALRTLDPDDDRHRVILDQVDRADVVAACRARLETGGEGRSR